MSKILEATCEDEVVTSNGVEVPMAEILSKGLGASSGALLIEGKKAWYITSSASDLEEIIDKVVDALEKVSSALETLNTTNVTDGAPIAAAASDIVQVDSAIEELESFKEMLK